jgi:hypothetical protein
MQDAESVYSPDTYMQQTQTLGPFNDISLCPTHLVDVKKGGLYIGIYVKAINDKRRGVILTYAAWIGLLNKIDTINLGIDFERGVALGTADALYGNWYNGVRQEQSANYDTSQQQSVTVYDGCQSDQLTAAGWCSQQPATNYDGYPEEQSPIEEASGGYKTLCTRPTICQGQPSVDTTPQPHPWCRDVEEWLGSVDFTSNSTPQTGVTTDDTWYQ